MYNESMKTLYWVIGLLILISYIWIAVFGLFQVTHMSHMGTGMHHCPFMIGQQSICPMDAVHHLQMWQVFSTVVIPLFEILLFSLCVFVVLRFWYSSPPLFSFTRQQYKKSFTPLYQQLFSQGILHPKAP
jgi:hypothetical protein